MKTEKEYNIQVTSSSPMITSIGPIGDFDDYLDIEVLGDEEGWYYYKTLEDAEKEILKLKENQPIKIPRTKFRIVETITNFGDWK